jgi:chemotaxis protein CheX
MITLSDSTLQDAVADVLAGLLGHALDQFPNRPDAPSLTASVPLTGSFEGLLAVRCLERTARELAATMFGETPDGLADSDVADAMGEVANQVGGVVKTFLPAPSVLGLPVVVAGTRLGRTDLPFLSSVSLERDEGHVDVFVFGRPCGDATT